MKGIPPFGMKHKQINELIDAALGDNNDEQKEQEEVEEEYRLSQIYRILKDYTTEVLNNSHLSPVFHPHAVQATLDLTNYAAGHAIGAQKERGHGGFSLPHTDCVDGRLLSYNI